VKKYLNKKYWIEIFEDPIWFWGFRIAISIAGPILYGIITGRQSEAVWIAVAAEASAFIEMKGDLAQRIRIACGSIILNIIFAIIGGVLGNYWIPALVVIFIIGLLSGLFKNLGEKGSALSLSIFICGIVNISFPITSLQDLDDRAFLFLLGGLWAGIVNIVAVMFMKEGSPFRRSIAEIWNGVGKLAQVSGKGWDNKSKRESLRTLYLAEKNLRNSINESISYFDATVDKVKDENSKEFKLAQSRKVAVLVGLHVIQITEYIDQLEKSNIPYKSRLKIFSLYRSIENISERMAHYITNLKSEEALIINAKCDRISSMMANLKIDAEDNEYLKKHIGEIITLSERIIKLFRRGMVLLQGNNEKISVRSYTFLETLHILHPKYLWQNLKALLRSDGLTLKYALRVGIASSIGYILQHFFFTDHGYWITLTTIIVSQPYVNATLRKGLQRSLGTILGVLAGSVLLFVPIPTIAQVIMVIISSLLLVYFIKSKYTTATFFITTLLIATLYIEKTFDEDLMFMRILFTIIGSGIAIIAGFIFFPTFDKKLLPRFLAESMEANYIYFKQTFYNTDEILRSWTILKRNAEIKNSEAFDSVNRFIQETVVKRKKGFAQSYLFVIHNIRITRELNAYHTDNEFAEDLMPAHNKILFYQLLYEIDDLFREILILGSKKGNSFIHKDIINDYPVNGLKNLTPSEHQVLHLLKISNELKAIITSLKQ
jgi:uncharacterized membrane protein YgaE (UPF0421/DUF939 family)